MKIYLPGITAIAIAIAICAFTKRTSLSSMPSIYEYSGNDNSQVGFPQLWQTAPGVLICSSTFGSVICTVEFDGDLHAFRLFVDRKTQSQIVDSQLTTGEKYYEE